MKKPNHDSFHLSSGLSRRVIVKDAETGRTQTYSTSSDVLAQQFAVKVGPEAYCRFFQPVDQMGEKKNLCARCSSLLTYRSPCCSTDAALGKSSASTCGSEAAETTAGRLAASTKNPLSPLYTSWRMRTTWWHQTCKARSDLMLGICNWVTPVRALGMVCLRPPPPSLKAFWQHLCLPLLWTDQVVGRTGNQTSAGVQGAPQWTCLPSGPCVRRWGAFAGR